MTYQFPLPCDHAALCACDALDQCLRLVFSPRFDSVARRIEGYDGDVAVIPEIEDEPILAAKEAHADDSLAADDPSLTAAATLTADDGKDDDSFLEMETDDS